MLPLRWACYLAVNSINMHGTYLNTQILITYIYTNIKKKDKGKYMPQCCFEGASHYPAIQNECNEMAKFVEESCASL